MDSENGKSVSYHDIVERLKAVEDGLGAFKIGFEKFKDNDFKEVLKTINDTCKDMVQVKVIMGILKWVGYTIVGFLILNLAAVITFWVTYAKVK
jgi:hypothetical protein